jgi:hypothetical protein
MAKRTNPTYQGAPCKRGHSGLRYKANGTCTECLVARTAEARRQTRARTPGTDPATAKRKQLYAFAQRRCMTDGTTFTITLDDVAIPLTCPILDTPMHHCTLMSIDVALGYVPGNVVVVSTRAANIRNGASSCELRAVADWLDANSWLN